MQNGRFVTLTGHLNDYPLSDLVGILRHQRKSGRLLIEYPKGPASFYFEEGALVDAQFDNLGGLQAICVVLAQPASPFNFNPLIKPLSRSIENSLQRVVSELLGCWDESPLQLDATVTATSLPSTDDRATLEPGVATAHGLSTVEPVALLPPAQRSAFAINRMILVMAAAGLMMLGLSTVIAVTSRFKSRAETVRTVYLPSEPIVRAEHLDGQASVSETRKSLTQSEGLRTKNGSASLGSRHMRETEEALNRGIPTDSTSPTGVAVSNPADQKAVQSYAAVRSVDVIMQVENGRVLQASIANHKEGMDGYEALALRIARQRRYPTKSKSQETVKIRVGDPD